MNKQQQFLWIVQTVILANAINLASHVDMADTYQVDRSASGILITCDDALDASERIPENMGAYEAAQEFCTYMLTNLRDIEDKAGNNLTVPGWFARG